jgi:hypothetical protein
LNSGELQFDGLITFFASHHAMRAEKILKKNGYIVLLVPGPREISPNCGVALQFDYGFKKEVEEILSNGKVQIEGIHQYKIELTEAAKKRLRAR